jgi:hypothetical protein
MLAGRVEDPALRDAFLNRVPWNKYLERLRQDLDSRASPRQS